ADTLPIQHQFCFSNRFYKKQLYQPGNIGEYIFCVFSFPCRPTFINVAKQVQVLCMAVAIVNLQYYIMGIAFV
ncbi:hypothetical protein, partial [Stenotrophomonas geniculata]|uniref:hypothetical protein n=1 Tax=Stenotrophomonas geniculata TaxID=86188 RepID=UPI003BF8D8F1